MIITFLALFRLFNAIHGSKDWLQYSILSVPLVNDVNKKLSSQELKTDNHKESAEDLINNNYFNRLTPYENAGSKKVTNPTITDTTYEYSNLVLTTAIKILRKEKFTADSNITRNDITKYFKKTISEPKDVTKIFQVSQPFKNLGDSFSYRDFTRSESDSLETATDENEYRVHTPARRIFYGHKTKIKHFPFLVTVHVLGRFVCGGTIIESNLVITAAACLKRWQEWRRRTSTQLTQQTLTTGENTTVMMTTDVTATETTNTATDVTEKTTTTTKAQQSSSEEGGKSSSYETTAPPATEPPIETPRPDSPDDRVLSVRIGTNYYRLEGKVVRVVNVFFHPSYNEKNLQNNLVIMRLERHLNLKRRRVRKIDISTLAVDLPGNTEVTIAGWGAKTYQNKVYNALWNLIHKTVMTVSPRFQCAAKYPDSWNKLAHEQRR